MSTWLAILAVVIAYAVVGLAAMRLLGWIRGEDDGDAE